MGLPVRTVVAREHRGHRLGLLVKTAMLEMLAAAEPALRRILTGNAGANQHMIAINAELGFEVLDEWQSWELEVAAVPQERSRPQARAAVAARAAVSWPAVSRPGGAAR